jgi:hypothetical protein
MHCRAAASASPPPSSGTARGCEDHRNPSGQLLFHLVSGLCRMVTLKRVSTEMSLQVLAYNMKRVLAIIGTGPLLEAMRA